MANREMCKKVLDYIEEHPEEHYQGSFGSKNACGTTACIAGHAILLDGGYMNNDGDFFTESGDIIWNESTAGRTILGLRIDEEDALFYDWDNESALAKLRLLAQGEEIV